MKTNSQPLFRSAAAVALSALFLAACSGGKEQGGAPGAGGPPPAPAVTVMTLKSESVPMVVELPGRTTPYLIAELRPQVTGIVTERAFNEGSEVKAGQVLYRIDPAPYQAAFDSAKAALARAEANAQVARIKADRHAALVKIEAVSKQANDDAQAGLKQAQAEVAAAKAALDKAKIDLDYTRLKSPIAGRIGRSAVTAGALVTANQAQALVLMPVPGSAGSQPVSGSTAMSPPPPRGARRCAGSRCGCPRSAAPAQCAHPVHAKPDSRQPPVRSARVRQHGAPHQTPRNFPVRRH